MAVYLDSIVGSASIGVYSMATERFVVIPKAVPHKKAERFADWLSDAGASSVEAVRLRPYSSRFYLLVDAEITLSQSLRAFCARWGDEAEHFPRRYFG